MVFMTTNSNLVDAAEKIELFVHVLNSYYRTVVIAPLNMVQDEAFPEKEVTDYESVMLADTANKNKRRHPNEVECVYTIWCRYILSSRFRAF